MNQDLHHGLLGPGRPPIVLRENKIQRYFRLSCITIIDAGAICVHEDNEPAQIDPGPGDPSKCLQSLYPGTIASDAGLDPSAYPNKR
jgi:hypothetical protein